ncbi:gfo/Idh/MocA family oxidoreductase [Saccharopolyspora rhizosphaerae]|uniref:Gfo/Idh/MocA family oxidoreductase n=1 Tax=Saccharopolyspora rhizosphaerae TaxID=2492662 RepID=A0A3R8VMD4_9PSEU|nr:Gfo/Idh/MocA family oxidoreductase [Saccharopolyspora rhizosphaerae]RRO20643.1 gfo/Idh/MocA family oxidoreductase [Saccharopolyspora rhizosphaerae]
MDALRVRWGVLGCSAIAERRALPALREIDGSEVVGVASRTTERAERFAAEHGGTALSYQELVDAPDIDAVYLSLPNSLHFGWAERALRASKHVLCEKPMTVSADQTDALVALAAERGLVLRENFAFLHHPQHDVVRALLERGRLGRLRTFSSAFGVPPPKPGDIRYDPALGAGCLLDVGVYPIRAAQLMLGDGLTVAGATLRVDTETGVDMAGHALLVSENGVFADLEFGFQHSYRSRYALWGDAAHLSLERAFTPPAEHRPQLLLEEQDHREEFTLDGADQFRASLASFATAVRETRGAEEEREWLRSARETARLVEAVQQTAVRVRQRGAVPS